MKTEKALGVLFLISLLFRLMHWNGGDFLLLITLSALSLVYFPLSFYFFSGKNLKDQNVPLSIAAGLFLSITTTGVLFKQMHWKGSQPLLLIGTVAALVLLVVSLFMKSKESASSNYYKQLLVRSGVLGGLALVLYFTPMSTLLHIQHWDDAQLAKLKYRSFSNPSNAEYRNELIEYQAKRK
jgi:hypothetical protein